MDFILNLVNIYANECIMFRPEVQRNMEYSMVNFLQTILVPFGYYH